MCLVSLVSTFFSGYSFVFAEETSSIPEQTTTTITIREPFPMQDPDIEVDVETGSINILSSYISDIFRFVAALSVIIAVLVVMAAGFKIMIAGGDSGARGEAKDLVVKTFMGLALLFLAGLFLKVVNPNFYIL